VVTGLAVATAAVRPGDVFVALPGTKTHGARYAAQAVAAGAVGIITDSAGAALAAGAGAPVLAVADPRELMADLAARLAGHPGDRLRVIGVTGTNGKTTTVFCVAALLEGLGVPTATIGTMGVRWRGARLDIGSTTVTTPEAPQIQAGLARLVAAGCQAVGMEVSSHALALRRVDGLRFAAAGFTNLGADHLDFHETLDAYFEAKARLFEKGRAAAAVIHTDDPAGARLADRARAAKVPVTTLGRRTGVDLWIAAEEPGAAGATHVAVTAPDATYEFDLALPGAHNVTDAALAVGLVRAIGLDPRPGLAALAAVRVPGRVQLIDLPGPAPRVYVDFAHTPQAIASTLDALKLPKGAPGRLIAVLGAGGDRDVSKRGPMGAAAAERAAVVIVTDDNPRSENPAAIREAVLAGARAVRDSGGRRDRRFRAWPTPVEISDGGDRRSAIQQALALAGPDDVVAVLGKGHETTQEIAGEFLPCDDAAIITESWSHRGETHT
jgi:UDP-N-acetylmuramoyl-L-alanyl-D-glutamate--2,6-diaminopimelate ligase